jgi:hypothetical protein
MKHLTAIMTSMLIITAAPWPAASEGLTPGDDCTTATNEISSLPFTDTGTTTGASNALNLVGPGPCLGVAFPTGSDVIYRIRVDVACTLLVTETPGSAWDAVIWVVSDCADPATACVALGDTGGPGSAESLTFSPTPGADYYLVVDGWSGNSGDYTLNITELGTTGCSLVVPVELTSFTVG